MWFVLTDLLRHLVALLRRAAVARLVGRLAHLFVIGFTNFLFLSFTIVFINSFANFFYRILALNILFLPAASVNNILTDLLDIRPAGFNLRKENQISYL